MAPSGLQKKVVFSISNFDCCRISILNPMVCLDRSLQLLEDFRRIFEARRETILCNMFNNPEPNFVCKGNNSDISLQPSLFLTVVY